jgi:hypothetical protein
MACILSVTDKPFTFSVIMLSVAMLSVVMLSVVMLSVVMLSVVMLSVVMLSVVMLSVVMLSVVMLSVVMLSVVAPAHQLICDTLGFVWPNCTGMLLTRLVIEWMCLPKSNALAYRLLS